MAQDSRNTAVTVAIVGAVATVLTAVIANWSTLTSHHPPATVAPPSAPAPAVSSQPIVPVGGGDDRAGLTNASTGASAPPAGSDFILPQSATRPLTAADIASLSPAELRMARNEIYARHGRIFVSADLASYFSRFPWYHPTSTDVVLSQMESRNAMFLLAAERSRGPNG